MYKRNKTESPIAISGYELESCMEGADIFDSALLYRLSLDQSLPRENYVVTENWYRPDLIATKFYGDSKYESFVILQAGSIKNIKPGAVLSLISKIAINNLKDGIKTKL
jgi:hypothetical protein